MAIKPFINITLVLKFSEFFAQNMVEIRISTGKCWSNIKSRYFRHYKNSLHYDRDRLVSQILNMYVQLLFHNSETVFWRNLSNRFVQKGSTYCFNIFCQQWLADFSKSCFDYHMGGKKACKSTQTDCNVQIFFTISPSWHRIFIS